MAVPAVPNQVHSSLIAGSEEDVYDLPIAVSIRREIFILPDSSTGMYRGKGNNTPEGRGELAANRSLAQKGKSSKGLV